MYSKNAIQLCAQRSKVDDLVYGLDLAKMNAKN